MAEKKPLIPTWGYDAVTGNPELFEIEEGGKLPEGYVDSPAKAKPAKAK